MAMTFTYDNAPGAVAKGAMRKIICAWTSDAGGDATGATVKLSGELIKGETVPGVGAAQPDDNYNIVITDEEGLNVLAPCFDDLLLRDETNTETVYFNLTDGVAPIGAYPVVDDALTVTVDSAGATTTGELTLYWRP